MQFVTNHILANENVVNVPSACKTRSLTSWARSVGNRLHKRREQIARLTNEIQADPSVIDLVNSLKADGTGSAYDSDHRKHSAFSKSVPLTGTLHAFSNTNSDPVGCFESNIRAHTNQFLRETGGRRWRRDFTNVETLVGRSNGRRQMLRLQQRGSRKENQSKPKTTNFKAHKHADMFLLHVDSSKQYCQRNTSSHRTRPVEKTRKPFLVSQCVQTDVEETTIRVRKKEETEPPPVEEPPRKTAVSVAAQTDKHEPHPDSGDNRYRRPFLFVQDFACEDTPSTGTIKNDDAPSIQTLGSPIQLGEDGEPIRSVPLQTEEPAVSEMLTEEQQLNKCTDPEERDDDVSYDPLDQLDPQYADSPVERTVTEVDDDSLEELQREQLSSGFRDVRERLANMNRRMTALDSKATVINGEFSDMTNVRFFTMMCLPPHELT